MSQIEVNKINPATGTTLTVGDSGDTITITAGASLTGPIAAAGLTGALPAISGASLTSLNATNLGSGTVPDARFPATLPAASGVNLTSLNATNLGSGTVPTARLGTGTASSTTYLAGDQTYKSLSEYDDNQIQSNIAFLGFKVAVNGSLVKYNLVDQAIDEYEDASGVDASASTNEIRDASGKYYSGTSTGSNYFGDGSDGAVTISTSTDLTVSNTQGSYDGDMVFKQYTSLTVDSGQTLSTNVPCRGMFIYVTGDCVINGTISMTGKGAYANPASTSSPTWGSAGSDGNLLGSDGLRLGLVKSGSTESLTNDGSDFNGCGTAVRTGVANQDDLSSNGKIYKVARTSSAAGATVGTTPTAGNAGASGQSIFATGGGGSGATSQSITPAGAAATGTCWSGGSGGAGVHNSTGAGANATAYGGPAGSGNFGGNAGGAGNPGGVGNGGHGGTGETGTGGTIWLIVGGTLSGSGTMESHGKAGGAFVANTCGGGGGSGGGAIVVAAVTDSSSITLTATGGAGTTGGSGSSRNGGNGGIGYVIKEGGITGDVISNMTLIANDTTAEAEPDNADMVTLIENAAGTATLNTDIKGYVSRDSGTTFTQGTLVDEGTWGTNKKILAFHDLDISSQPSGTSMCYKIETLNQSASIDTRIYATSMGWR